MDRLTLLRPCLTLPVIALVLAGPDGPVRQAPASRVVLEVCGRPDSTVKLRLPAAAESPDDDSPRTTRPKRIRLIAESDGGSQSPQAKHPMRISLTVDPPPPGRTVRPSPSSRPHAGPETPPDQTLGTAANLAPHKPAAADDNSLLTPARPPRPPGGTAGWEAPLNLLRDEVTLSPSFRPLPEIRPFIQPEIRPVIQPEIRPVIQPEIRPEIHPEIRPEIAPVISPDHTVKAAPGQKPAAEQGVGQPPITVTQLPRPLPPPAGFPLPSAPRPAGRSEQLEQIARQADRLTRHGFELAGRRAYFAARAEFIKALRLTAQSMDDEHGTSLHSRALSAGLTAVAEAEDFLPAGSRLEGDLDLWGIVRGHRTPVLKDAQLDRLTPMSALKCYMTFAQEQLSAAAGGEVAGSMALHGLGKLHGTLAVQKSNHIRAAESKGIVFYQAALLACPQNHMAANDLGVLLAHCGNHQEAEAVLRGSLAIQKNSTSWQNLAAVYRRLGRPELARQADRSSQGRQRGQTAVGKAPRNTSDRSVRWVDADTFAEAHRSARPTPQSALSVRQSSPAASKPDAAAAQQPASTMKTLVSRWLPWVWEEKKRN